jgi:F-type H+-transporting ATPase subunit alpha
MPERSSQPPDYRFGLRLSERGSVVGVGDGIAWVRGLPSAHLDELISFDDGSTGLVFQLAEHLLGAILLSQQHGLTAGMAVQRTGRRPSSSAISSVSRCTPAARSSTP